MLWAVMQACSNVLKPREAKSPRVEEIPFLAFRVAGHVFGVRMQDVREVVRCGIMAVPSDKPSCVRGFFRHKAHMFPVIDLARRYSGHDTETNSRSCIVIVGPNDAPSGWQVGILAEEIVGMDEFSPDEIKPLPEEAHRLMNVAVLDGLVKRTRDYLMVLAPERILTREETRELRAYMADFP
jgi:chemotaxis signal transduction protein